MELKKQNQPNRLVRVDNDFDNEIEDVILKRIENGIDEKPTSKPKITGLISKHLSWSRMKQDLINFRFGLDKNKKGQITLFILAGIFVAFTFLILLLVSGSVVSKMNTYLSQNITMGNVDLGATTSATFTPFATMLLNYADWWGIACIFGMILGLFISAYMLRGRYAKWGIILDIVMIVSIFIFALYLKGAYQTLLDSLAIAGETFLEDYANKSSWFLLNLPIFVPIIGAIMMVLFHASIPRKKEEQTFQGGFPGI